MRIADPHECPSAAVLRFRNGAWVIPTVILGALLSSILACGKIKPEVVEYEDIHLIDRFDAASTGPAAGEISAIFTPPLVKPEREMIFVPFGSQVEFPLELQAGSELVTRDTKVRGSATGRLQVTWTAADGGEMVVTGNLATTEFRSATIDIRKTQKGRLRLVASSREPSRHPGGGILVFEPRIRLRQAPKSAGPAELPSTTDRALPNIIVYLADALRADHLGCYGYRRNTSPNLDRLASTSVLFSNAQAQSSWTRPAVASLLTGLWPQQHHTISKEAVLPAQANTLAEILRQRGYATAAFVGNGNVANVYGFAQGFSFFRYLENVVPEQPVVRSTEINKAVLEWLDENGDRQPFFLFVHTVDPHLPYDPPDPYRSEFVGKVVDSEVGSAQRVHQLGAEKTKVTDDVVDTLVDLYDGEIAANDAAFGVLIDELKGRKLYDPSVLVFLSDHGEEFYDHQGWTHGNSLNSEVLDIPLIIKFPGKNEAVEVDHVVDHVDVFATLLDLVGVDVPSGVQGRSLLPLCDGERPSEWSDQTIAHLDLKERFSVSMIDGRWKLILRRRGGRDRVPELYDRVSDRSEKTDVAGQDPARVESMTRRLQAAEDEAADILEATRVNTVDDDEMKDQLKALGYIEE